MLLSSLIFRILAVLVLFTASARGDSDLASRLRMQESGIRRGCLTTRFELEDYLPDLSNACVPLQSRTDSACCQAYSRFFANPSVDIRVLIGYFNTESLPMFTLDPSMKRVLLEFLDQPCSSGPRRDFRACGFRPVPGAPDLRTKFVTGPDGRSREVRIRVESSAVALLDAENRLSPRQAAASAGAEASLLDGLMRADAVFYLGHSRSGGGPDFQPPRMRGGKVDYANYQRSQPGLQLLLRGLHQRERGRLKFLGLMSCSTADHFLDRVRRVAPEVGIVGSHSLTGIDEQIGATLGAIHALLSFSCEARFSQMLNPSRLTGGEQFALRGFFPLSE